MLQIYCEKTATNSILVNFSSTVEMFDKARRNLFGERLMTHCVWVGQVSGICQPAAQVVISTSPTHRQMKGRD